MPFQCIGGSSRRQRAGLLCSAGRHVEPLPKYLCERRALLCGPCWPVWVLEILSLNLISFFLLVTNSVLYGKRNYTAPTGWYCSTAGGALSLVVIWQVAGPEPHCRVEDVNSACMLIVFLIRTTGYFLFLLCCALCSEPARWFLLSVSMLLSFLPTAVASGKT